MSATYDAFPLKASIVALVTDVHDCGRVHEAITDYTFAIALFAETTEGDAGLFAAHDEIGVVLGHGQEIRLDTGREEEGEKVEG